MPQPIEARTPARPRRTAAIAAIALFGVVATARAAPLDDLRTLVEAGRAAEADAIFCAAADLSARPREFDLWCGVAAVDLGRAGEGVLALERYVLQFPNDTRARLELARAYSYFYAGDNVPSAREEFEAVAKEQPPAEVQAGIDRYLDALRVRESRVRESRYRTRATGYVEAGAGYDSNANAGVAQANIGLPVLGPVTVADVGVRTGSGFGFLMTLLPASCATIVQSKVPRSIGTPVILATLPMPFCGANVSPVPLRHPGVMLQRTGRPW
jgi:hypothetical protein